MLHTCCDVNSQWFHVISTIPSILYQYQICEYYYYISVGFYLLSKTM